MAQLDPKTWCETGGTRFVARPEHRQWLLSQAASLLAFFSRNVINPAGGFFTLDTLGKPISAGPGNNGIERKLHDTTRLVHCFAVAKLLGLQGSDDVIDHGMDFLWSRHRDIVHGGYFWGVDDLRPTNPAKRAYGHAFVLLAASSADIAAHPRARRLLGDVTDALLTHFWDAEVGATREEFSADWQSDDDYRGQNSNMHLCEALMAAHEATGARVYLDMAERIAKLIIRHHARALGWRVAEHFDADWRVDKAYAGDPVFRPRGVTPGHALEWSRLLVQLWELGNRQSVWMPDAAKRLFFTALETGWDDDTGGFYYTLDWDNQPDRADRFWWPCAEGIAAASVLGAIDDDPNIETWYRRIWGFVDGHIIDHQHGGWFPEMGPDLKPVNHVFVGKPDLYHALQACLIPLLPSNGSITRGLEGAKLKLPPRDSDALIKG